jgi:hypothetical protein
VTAGGHHDADVTPPSWRRTTSRGAHAEQPSPMRYHERTDRSGRIFVSTRAATLVQLFACPAPISFRGGAAALALALPLSSGVE